MAATRGEKNQIPEDKLIRKPQLKDHVAEHILPTKDAD